MGVKSKLEEIVAGWKNVIFTDKAVEEMALKRATICAECPHNVNKICQECGCPLVAKTRSPQSKCPKNKW